MAILTFPSIIAERQDFGVRYNTQISPSKVSGFMQRVELPGARWRGTLGYSELTPVEAATLKGFLLELRGSSGSFFYGDAAHTSPFTPITGSPTIAGGSTPGLIDVSVTTGSFTVGDYIQIGTDDQRELKMVISVAGDDIGIEPLIRRTDYIGKPVVYTNPKGVFLLTSDEQALWSTRGKALLSDINIEFVEDFA
jgi:hypothetical protein